MFEALFGGGFNPNKCKTQLRLCVSRIRLLQNKKAITVRTQRKDIAKLLAAGKEDSARIRVEALIQEESTVIAYEILELYCELLSVRVQLMKMNKGLPEDMQESVASIVYAAQRCSAQLPELQAVKSQLQAKYGKEYVMRAQSDETCLNEQVNPRLVDSLAIKVPPPKKKLALLSEIALEHNVDWEVVTGEDCPADQGGEHQNQEDTQPTYPSIAAGSQYPNIQFTEDATDFQEDSPKSPQGSIAVGTPVHPGDSPLLPGGSVGKVGVEPTPPTAPVLKGAEDTDAGAMPDLPDTPSPLNLSLNVRVMDADPDPGSTSSAGGSTSDAKIKAGDGEEESGGMDELSKRLDALKTGKQLPKPPKNF